MRQSVMDPGAPGDCGKTKPNKANLRIIADYNTGVWPGKVRKLSLIRSENQRQGPRRVLGQVV